MQSGNLEVSGAGCQVLDRLTVFQAWKSGVLEGGEATEVSLKAIFKLNFF